MSNSTTTLACTLFFYDDHRDAVTDLRNRWIPSNATGTAWDTSRIVAAYEYDAYGNVHMASGTYNADNAFRFSTKWFDDESGVGYWGCRYYSSPLGAWLNRDPLGTRDDPNVTRYVRNQPSATYDVLGLACDEAEAAKLLAELVAKWDKLGFEFSATVLTLFLTKAGLDYNSPSNAIDLSMHSNIIQSDDWYRNALRSYVIGHLGDKCGSRRLELPDRIPHQGNPAFRVEYAGIGWYLYRAPTSGRDLTWALGTGHFGHTGAVIDVTLTKDCCHKVVFQANMMQEDFVTLQPCARVLAGSGGSAPVWT
jgi:RHS repeat-associated protein